MLRYALLAVFIPFILYSYIVATGYDGVHYLRGDCPYYYITAVSIYADHDLDLSNQIEGDFLRHNGSLSLSADGRLVPKHPIVMPLFALPLIALFGPPGALAFNLIQLALLLFLTFRLAARYFSPVASMIAVILTAIGTLLPHYVWNFSGDLFSALLLISALLTVPVSATALHFRFRMIAAGFLFGLTIVSKFALLVFLPGLPLICPAPRIRNLALIAAGAAIPFVAFATYNYELFGSPFTTSYHRIAMLHEGKIVPYSQENDFNLPFRQGLYLEMFDRKHGLFFTSCLTLISFLALPLLAKKSLPMALYVGLGSLALYVFFSHYRLWYQTHVGNRFLIPAVVLGALPLASLIDLKLRKLHDARTHRGKSARFGSLKVTP